MELALAAAPRTGVLQAQSKEARNSFISSPLVSWRAGPGNDKPSRRHYQPVSQNYFLWSQPRVCAAIVASKADIGRTAGRGSESASDESGAGIGYLALVDRVSFGGGFALGGEDALTRVVGIR